jgi:uncharacterized DUF497 family protein
VLRFIWDDRNMAHLEQHGVRPALDEFVFFADDRKVVESIQGLGRYECEGSFEGRMNRLIFTGITDE